MSGSLTPTGNGMIEWLAVGGSANDCTTDTTGYTVSDTTIFLANAGNGSMTAGQRIKLNGDMNYYTLAYSIQDVSGAGLAVSSTTDATGFAIGVDTVNIAATGSGAILQGNVVNFAGDVTDYTVTTGLNDVSVGGTITFTPALVTAIPAAATAITCRNALTFKIGLQQAITAGFSKSIYTGGELKRPSLLNVPIVSSGVFESGVSDDLNLLWAKKGQIIQFTLDQGYSVLSVKDDSERNRTISTSGESQTRTISENELYAVSIKFIDDIRTTGTTDLEAILSMFEALDSGVLAAWFPDYVARPTEYYLVTLEKRNDPKRQGTTHWHGFDFTLRVETGTSVTIPTFGV